MKFILTLILMCSPALADCVIKDNRPDPTCTPGAMMPGVTVKDICTPHYTAGVRNVPAKLKREVFASYGMDNKKAPCPCEVDHFVSLELGGSNDLSNLWPEPYENPDGARKKDAVENWLHHQICKGNITLAEAQRLITDDWKRVYRGMHK